MIDDNTYRFRRLDCDDLPLLERWLSNSHVREWWLSSKRYDAEDLTDDRIMRFVVLLNSRPIAFMQDYNVHGWKDHHFYGLPKGSRGIDQYIGEQEMVGRGHGSAFIAQRMKDLFNDGVPFIATDPHPRNARAIAVYTKLGFRKVGPIEETRWGMIQPMVADQCNND